MAGARGLVVVLALAAAWAGCGGGAADTCGRVAPCGGAVGYCVSGDRLHVISLGAATTAGADLLVIGDLVGMRENP